MKKPNATPKKTAEEPAADRTKLEIARLRESRDFWMNEARKISGQLTAARQMIETVLGRNPRDGDNVLF